MDEVQDTDHPFDSGDTEDNSTIAEAAAAVPNDHINWRVEPDKFLAWYDLQFPKRCRALMRNPGLTEDEAKEVVQEAFLELLNKNPILYRETRDTFLCRICSCRAVDFIRKWGLERLLVPLDDCVANMVFVSSPDPTLILALRETLRSLDPTEQRILIFKVVYGHTFNQLAQRLKLDVKTLENRYYPLLDKCAAALGTVRKINRHSKSESGLASGAAHVAGGLR